MDEVVRRLAARAEIGECLARYCRALDGMTLEALREIFTEECRVEFGADPRLNATGVEALAAALARLWRWSRTSHHLGNVEIAFRGEAAADVVSYVLAWHERPDGSTATLYGLYRDHFVRTGAGWRIAVRRQEMNGASEGFRLGIFPVARRPPPPGWTPPAIEPPPPQRT